MVTTAEHPPETVPPAPSVDVVGQFRRLRPTWTLQDVIDYVQASSVTAAEMLKLSERV